MQSVPYWRLDENLAGLLLIEPRYLGNAPTK